MYTGELSNEASIILTIFLKFKLNMTECKLLFKFLGKSSFLLKNKKVQIKSYLNKYLYIVNVK